MDTTEVRILKKELAIAVRALKWYANANNWDRDEWNVPGLLTPDYRDPGGKAKRALEQMRKVT